EDVQPWLEDWYKATHPSGRYTFSDFEELQGHDIARGFDEFYESMPSNTKIDYFGYLFNKRVKPNIANDTAWVLYYYYHLPPDTSIGWISKVELREGHYRVLVNKQRALDDTTYCRLAREYNEDHINKIKMLLDFGSLAKDIGVDSISLRQKIE